METTGVVRRIDDLGRIVIPKEIRRTLGIKDGTSLEIFVERDMVTLKKHSSMNSLVQLAEVYVESVYNAVGYDILITDRDNVIATSPKLKKDYLGMNISEEMEELINSCSSVTEKSITDIEIIKGKKDIFSYILYPIISNGESIGLIIILSNDRSITDLEYKLAQVAAHFFGKHIEQ